MAKNSTLENLLKDFEKQESKYWSKTKGFGAAIEESPKYDTKKHLKILKEAQKAMDEVE